MDNSVTDSAYTNFAQILSLKDTSVVYAYGGHERLLKRVLDDTDR